ncbi:MAG: ribonuclease P protein component [Lautropia sp.]|nr:ribonuclease P protein component [Lautropia sp.]
MAARDFPAAQAPRASVPVPDIQISVPKRLVRSAVSRNTVKRVLREAWRAACLQPSNTLKAEAIVSGSGSSATASSPPTASPLACPDRIWRFTLKAHPGGNLLAKSQHARARMRLAARKVPVSGSRGQAVESPLLLAGAFAHHKRVLRAEADALLADALRKLVRPVGDRSVRQRGRQVSS